MIELLAEFVIVRDYLYYKHLTPNGVKTSLVFAPEERNDCRKTYPPKRVCSVGALYSEF